MKIMIKALVLINFLAVTIWSMNITAKAVDAELLSDLYTFNGKAIAIDKEKITHFVVIDLWRSYEGKGDEKMIASLPEKFLQQSQQVWLQPEVNVTLAQLVEYQQYFSQVKPLILDKQFLLMRELGVWQSPFHVLVQDKEILFSGDDQALLNFINKKYSIGKKKIVSEQKGQLALENSSNNAQAEKQIVAGNLSTLVSKLAKPYKPIAGDIAPLFATETLSGNKVTLADTLVKLNDKKVLKLVFIDALCPMPHFPGCEEKLARVNELVAADKNNQWLGVVNSYYVNKDYVQQFVDKFELKLPLIFDQDNAIYRAYDVYASPYLIKINQQGVIESRGDVLN